MLTIVIQQTHSALKRLFARLTVVTLAMTALPLTSGLAHADGFAYVDLQRAVFEVNDGKIAKARLEKMKTQRQGALDDKQKELKKLQESLEKQADFMSEDVKAKKAEEFRTKLGDLQQTYATLQRELAEEEMKIQQKILGQMGEVLKAMGEEGSYTMIVRKDALLWAPPHLDVTNELIRRYNTSTNTKGGRVKARKKKKKAGRKKAGKKNP